MDKDAKNKVQEQDQLLDALRELTKGVGEISKEMSALKEEWQKWRKAGKF